VLTNRRMNAHAPALFVDIQTDEDRLTREIKFVTVIHGKSLHAAQKSSLF